MLNNPNWRKKYLIAIADILLVEQKIGGISKLQKEKLHDDRLTSKLSCKITLYYEICLVLWLYW